MGGVFYSNVFDGGVFDIGVNGGGGPQSYYWGPHFPDAAGGHYWHPHFPEGFADTSIIPPVGPGSAVTFALDLQAGTTLVMTWDTDVFKSYDGTEQRRSKLELPKRKIAGTAFLRGSLARSVRSALSRYSYIGSPFLISLPWEEMVLTDDSETAVLPVGNTALIDWAVPGQRAIVTREDEDTEETLFDDVIIQAVGINALTINGSAPELTLAGASIIPTAAVILDPQQGIARYATEDAREKWSIQCTAILFGYQQDSNTAIASLAESAGALSNATLAFVSAGPAGNGYRVQWLGDLLVGPATFEVVTPTSYIFHFVPNLTKVSDFLDDAIALFTLLGTYNVNDVFTTGDAINVVLAGGSDSFFGAMGNGATLEYFNGRPIWDRGVTVDDVATDSLQSLTTIIDLGGKPISVGQANAADWGRDIVCRDDLGAPWQWLKLFLYTVGGRFKSWWLPSYRADLDAVAGSSSGITLKVAGPSLDSGDFFGWYPRCRNELVIEQEDGTITYGHIESALDNHDGTISISCRGPAPIAGPAFIAFPTGQLNLGGYKITRSTDVSLGGHIGASGNFGSIELRADGTGGSPLGGGGIQVTTDGAGQNIVIHFNPGNAFVEDVVFNTVLLYYPPDFPFQWSNTVPLSTLLTLADVQGPLPFAGGVDVGTPGELVVLSSSPIDKVSWLELCHFESDEFTVTFNASTFELKTSARVVQK